MKILKYLAMSILLTYSLVAGVAYNESTLVHDENPLDGGASVSVSGEWAAVGAYDPNDSKSCYISMYRFNYDPGIWQWEFFQTLPSKGTISCNGNKGLGVAVSLNGIRLAAGLENFDDGSDKDIGAFSTYEFDGAEWVARVEHIVNPDANALSGFGETLSIRGEYLIVGAPNHDDTIGLDTGKVYVYDWDDLVTDTTPIASKVGEAAGENFGKSVTGEGTQLLVGAPGYDEGNKTDNGAAYLYDFNGTGFDLVVQLIGEYENAQMGTQVAMDSENVMASGDHVESFINTNGVWRRGIVRLGTNYADVSISGGVFAMGVLGTSVEHFQDISGPIFATRYHADVTPTTVDAAETAKDISLYKNQLLVKHSTIEPAYAYEMPCGFGTQIQENTWSLVGVPCEVTAGTTVAEAFNKNTSDGSRDNLGTYGDNANWVVYEQNSTYGATTASYRLMAEDDTVTQGKGYWIICDHNVTTRVDETVSATRTPLYSALAGGDIGATTLQDLPDGNATGEGFTKVLLVNDLPREIHWGNVQLGADGFTSTTMGSPSSRTVFDQATAYVYDETGASQPYRAITTTPGFGDVIEPGQGYWVKILAPSTGVTIALPYEK